MPRSRGAEFTSGSMTTSAVAAAAAAMPTAVPGDSVSTARMMPTFSNASTALQAQRRGASPTVVLYSQFTGLDGARFSALQTPLAAEIARLAAFPFAPSSGAAVTYCCAFSLSNEHIALLVNGGYALHARMFSSKAVDIQWLAHCNLRLNNELIDLTPNARKLRTKSAINALVMPLAANLTRAARPGANQLLFRAATVGDVGHLVVQLVRTDSAAVAASAIARTAQRLTYRAARAASAAAAMSAKTATLANLDGAVDNGDDDDEVEEQAYVASLNDPVSFMRIQVPVRGVACRHAQCFDLATYLEFSHGNQYFNCPVCRLPTPASDLCVDNFFADMLTALVDRDDDRVIINADGTFVAATAPPAAVTTAAPLVVQRALAAKAVNAFDVDALHDDDPTLQHASGADYRPVTTMTMTTTTTVVNPLSETPQSVISGVVSIPNIVPLVLNDVADDVSVFVAATSAATSLADTTTTTVLASGTFKRSVGALYQSSGAVPTAVTQNSTDLSSKRARTAPTATDTVIILDDD